MLIGENPPYRIAKRKYRLQITPPRLVEGASQIRHLGIRDSISGRPAFSADVFHADAHRLPKRKYVTYVPIRLAPNLIFGGAPIVKWFLPVRAYGLLRNVVVEDNRR